MSNIYELTEELFTLKSTLSEMFESGDIDETTLNDTLVGERGELDAKIANYGRVISELSIESLAIKDVAKRNLERAKAIDKNIATMKATVLNTMSTFDISKVTENDIVISTRKSSKVIVDDEEMALKKYG